MKKSILNLGKALNKVEQKSINGGEIIYCGNPGGFCNAFFVCEPINDGTGRGVCITIDII